MNVLQGNPEKAQKISRKILFFEMSTSQVTLVLCIVYLESK